MFNYQIISPKNIISTLSPRIQARTYINSVEALFLMIFAGRVGIWQSFSLCSFSDMFSGVVWWKMKYRQFLSMLLWSLARMRRVRPISSPRISEYYPLFIPVLCPICQMNRMGKEECQLSRGSFHTLRNFMLSFRMTIRLLCALRWCRTSGQSHLLILEISENKCADFLCATYSWHVQDTMLQHLDLNVL